MSKEKVYLLDCSIELVELHRLITGYDVQGHSNFVRSLLVVA